MEVQEFVDKKNSIYDLLDFFFGQGHFGILTTRQWSELMEGIQDRLYGYLVKPQIVFSKPEQQTRQTFPEFINIIHETNRRLYGQKNN